MKQSNKNLVVWEFENIISAVEAGQYEKLNISKLENLILQKMPRQLDMVGDALPKIDTLAVSLSRALNKTSIAERSRRDDMLLAITLLYSVIGGDAKVDDLIAKVQKKQIDGINEKFVLDKMYNFKEKGKKLSNGHKIWSKLVRAYKRGEITAVKGHSRKVEAMLDKEMKKGFFQKIIEFIGL